MQRFITSETPDGSQLDALAELVRSLKASDQSHGTTESSRHLSPRDHEPSAAPSDHQLSRGSLDRQASDGIVFVCYRREDTPDAAGRLQDKLIDTYGIDRVFMDIDSVPLGIDYVEHVQEQMGRCRAVIIMIGPRWLSILDKRGRRRLELEDDMVRAEVEAALQQKVPVIP